MSLHSSSTSRPGAQFYAREAGALLTKLGVDAPHYTEGGLISRSPITGEILGRVSETETADAAAMIEAAHGAFLQWRLIPAPRRGELIRLVGEEFRTSKADLARLLSIEVGKIFSESLGEVQEVIDICDFAIGMSRQLHGLTIATERAEHRMMETWHPLGVVGIVSAFNFPVAVWAWNAVLALICGNSVVWKPSEKTPLLSLATQSIFHRALRRFRLDGGEVPADLFLTFYGSRELSEALVDHKLVALVSATGSTAMGRAVAPRLAQRFARAILELGGNNGAIVTPTANLDLSIRAIAFAAMGTAGQRCTSLRRLFVHETIYDRFVSRLKIAYASVSIGDPLQSETLVGPLIDGAAFEKMQRALQEAREHGGLIVGGERIGENETTAAYYVRPALVEMPKQIGPVVDECFAPILYVMKYSDFEQVLRLHNEVLQGLSSAIFTNDLIEAERFIAADGSDCGIANVNLGPSGAEIGGAFGGEKDTGGGRESGSDCWKSYMRRATNTINYGRSLQLAQGVKFELADLN